MRVVGPPCCNLDSLWVENVPGKGYYFCSECKNEVTVPKLDVRMADELDFNDFDGMQDYWRMLTKGV